MSTARSSRWRVVEVGGHSSILPAAICPQGRCRGQPGMAGDLARIKVEDGPSRHLDGEEARVEAPRVDARRLPAGNRDQAIGGQDQVVALEDLGQGRAGRRRRWARKATSSAAISRSDVAGEPSARSATRTPASSNSSRIAATRAASPLRARARACGCPSPGSIRPPGKTCRPAPKAIDSGRKVRRTSGPFEGEDGPGRSSTTVAAGRAGAADPSASRLGRAGSRPVVTGEPRWSAPAAPRGRPVRSRASGTRSHGRRRPSTGHRARNGPRAVRWRSTPSPGGRRRPGAVESRARRSTGAPGSGAGGLADDRDLIDVGQAKVEGHEPLPEERGMARSHLRDQAERAFSGLAIASLAGHRRQPEKDRGRHRVARGDGIVLEVLGPGDQDLVIVARVEEAAGRVGEPLEDRVRQAARNDEPALVECRPIERQEPIGQAGVVLEDARSGRPAILPAPPQTALGRRAGDRRTRLPPRWRRAGSARRARRPRPPRRRPRPRPGPRWPVRSSRRGPCRRGSAAAAGLEPRAARPGSARGWSGRRRAGARTSRPARRRRHAPQDRPTVGLVPVAALRDVPGRQGQWQGEWQGQPQVLTLGRQGRGHLGGRPGERRALDAVGIRVTAGGQAADRRC